MLLLRAVVVEHAAVRVFLYVNETPGAYLGQVGVFHEGIAGRIVHNEGEWEGLPAGHLVHVATEGLDLFVHVGTGFLAIGLLLTELLRHASQHSFDGVQVTALGCVGNVQLNLGNGDGAVVTLDNLAI